VAALMERTPFAIDDVKDDEEDDDEDFLDDNDHDDEVMDEVIYLPICCILYFILMDNIFRWMPSLRHMTQD